MSYIQSLHHIVIRTKNNENVIPNEHSEELYRYAWGYVKSKNSFLYRINGMLDHIHLLVGIPSTIALADFVRGLKTSTNKWLKTNREKYPNFISWGGKYAAFTIRYQEEETTIEYIKNQREHHKKENKTYSYPVYAFRDIEELKRKDIHHSGHCSATLHNVPNDE